MELGLKGKVALVTGGSRGIGFAIARELAKEGARLSICARTESAIEEAAGRIRAESGVEALAVAADLAQAEAIRAAAAKTVAAFGRVDILVNNAGSTERGDFLTFPDEKYWVDWNGKLFATIRLSREVFPHMRQQRWGRIINIVGLAARNPQPNFMAGGTGNATLLNFTKALADLGAPHNILVTAVSPSTTRPPRWERRVEARAAAERKSLEEAIREEHARMPLGRIAEPEEVAAAVFLALPERPPRPRTFGDFVGDFRAGILQNQPLRLLLLASTFRIMGQKGIVVFIPLFAAQVLGLGSGGTGLLVSVFYGLGVLSQPLAGRLSDRHGRTLILSLLLAAGGILTLAMVRVTSATGAFLVSGIPGFVLLAVRPVIHAEATELSRQGLQSATMGVIFGLNEGVSSLSAVLGGWVAEAFGLRACFVFFALVLLGGACVSLFLERGAVLPAHAKKSA